MRRLKKRYGVSPAAGAEPGAGAAGERKCAEALEKEVALLGKEQTEARQVDLLLVDLDLREVGVDGEVGGDVLRDAVLQVAADAGRSRSLDSIGVTVRSVDTPREQVRLHFEIGAAGRHLQAFERSARTTL